MNKYRARDRITDIFFGRVLFIIIGFAFQIALIWGIVSWFRSYFVYFYALCTFLTLASVFSIIDRTMNPAYKISWIVTIELLPIIGLVIYLLTSGSMSKFNKNKMLEIEENTKPFLKRNEDIYNEVKACDRHVSGQLEYIQRTSGYTAYRNHKLEYFPLGENMFERMIQELEKAENFIFMEYFIIENGFMWGHIAEILIRKAEQGVDVRLTYDDLGCMFTMPTKYHRYLESKGIKCFCFNEINPLLSVRYNNRDHRKICIIDGKTAFTGGINLADEYMNKVVKFGHWKDTAVMVKGDCVWSFTVMFLSVWNHLKRTDSDFERFHIAQNYDETDGYVVPFSDTPADGEPLGENVYMNIINNAVDYVYITTPYLILDNEMITALCSAAKRGVDVRIITPHIPDKKVVFRLTRANYNILIKNKIRIFEYTNGFIHSKSFVSDDKLAVVGSINLDYRSLYLHFECALLMYKCSGIEKIKEDFIDTQSISEEVGAVKYGFLGQMLNSVLKIFAPMI